MHIRPLKIVRNKNLPAKNRKKFSRIYKKLLGLNIDNKKNPCYNKKSGVNRAKKERNYD